MFRIKTDVRQYKCESHDKVVRLIRNWVIRPEDEIYNEQEGDWEPIGEHEAFVSTFREMEKAEEGVAETVVTPEIDEDEDDEDVDGESEAEPADESKEQEDDSRPEPPTAPDGVTTGRDYADSDEITVMTEDRLDEVLEDDEADGESEAANRDDSERTERRDDLGDSNAAAGSEAEVSPDEPTEPEAEPPEDAPSMSASDAEEALKEASDARDEDDAVTSRDDLPEEVFATNRIEREESVSGTSETTDPEDEQKADAEQSDEEAWDEILQRLKDTDELDGEEIDKIQERRDEIAIGRDTPAPDETTDQTEDYYGASGGYDWHLPDYVAPTEADRKLGLHAERVTEADKDAVFPYPAPKQKDVVQTRTFELGEDDEIQEAAWPYGDLVVRGLAVVFVVGVILLMLLAL